MTEARVTEASDWLAVISLVSLIREVQLGELLSLLLWQSWGDSAFGQCPPAVLALVSISTLRGRDF